MSRTPPPGWAPLAEDTPYEAEQVLIAALQRGGDLARLRRVGSIGRLVVAVALAELRAQVPGATDDELRRRLAARWLPPDLVAAVERNRA